MAIDHIGAEALALIPPGTSPGRFLMLGRQHLTLTAEEWRTVALRTSRSVEGAPLDGLQPHGYSEPFLRWLGYREIESMDFSGYEGCSLVHDLNQPVPEDWHGRYDVVFDGGTIEHVFHFPNAIANAMRMVRPGGFFVSCTPSNNYNGHGFYQFSPELFFRIFEEGNGFRIRLLALAESTGSRAIYRVTDPEVAGHRVTFGGKGPVLLVLIAEKLRDEPLFQTIPSQSDYAATWQAGTLEKSPVSDSGRGFIAKVVHAIMPDSWRNRLRRFLAERNRAKRGLRGVTRVESLRKCWKDNQK